jgi:hypothetical protein
MSYAKTTKCLTIISLCDNALALDSIETDPDVQYDILRNAYDAVRTQQDEATATDYTECTPNGFRDYLDDSRTLAQGALTIAEAAITAEPLTPSPLPIGLILEGSGSGS